MQAYIRAISYYLPERVVSNEMLQEMHPGWEIDTITKRTGVQSRNIAAKGEIASDLARKSAEKLFKEHGIGPEEIDFILLCTQCPDYHSPASATILQDKLGIPKSAGALDFNLGCTGFVYGLSLAQGLLQTTHVRNVLLLTAETISNYLHPDDRGAWCLFGDGGAATLVSRDDRTKLAIGPFVFGSDGTGANDMIQVNGGARNPLYRERSPEATYDDFGYLKHDDYFYMNGANVFVFTLKTVPGMIREMMEKSGLSMEEIDLFIFHQANLFMLEVLRKKIKIPKEKFFTFMENCGNTVSASIPIALYEAIKAGKAHAGNVVLLAGFGVGSSWAATIVRL